MLCNEDTDKNSTANSRINCGNNNHSLKQTNGLTVCLRFPLCEETCFNAENYFQILSREKTARNLNKLSIIKVEIITLYKVVENSIISYFTCHYWNVL